MEGDASEATEEKGQEELAPEAEGAGFKGLGVGEVDSDGDNPEELASRMKNVGNQGDV